MNNLAKKTCLVAIVGMFGVFILAGAAEKNQAKRPIYHEQVITSMRAVPVYGLESEVPQKLIDELDIRSAGKSL